MKIAIVHGCMFASLADAIRRLAPQAEVSAFEYASIKKSCLAEKIAVTTVTSADFLIISPKRDYNKDIMLRLLRGFRGDILILPNFIFKGFHPDCIFIDSPEGGRLQGPTGGYHSRIVVAAYLSNLGTNATENLFNLLSYKKLNYMNEFERELNLVANLFARYNLDIKPYISKWSKYGCFMHSINHPIVGIIGDLAKMSCMNLNIPIIIENNDWTNLTDYLDAHPRHPIYPEIARKFGLSAKLEFLPEDQFRANIRMPMALPDFIRECFAVYERTSPKNLYNSAHVSGAMKILDLPRARY